MTEEQRDSTGKRLGNRTSEHYRFVRGCKRLKRDQLGTLRDDLIDEYTRTKTMLKNLDDCLKQEKRLARRKGKVWVNFPILKQREIVAARLDRCRRQLIALGGKRNKGKGALQQWLATNTSEDETPEPQEVESQ